MTRNRQLPDGHPLQCGRPGCPTQRTVINPEPLCLKHLAQLRRTKEIMEPEDTMLLEDDGIVDYVAVETLAKGWREVRATRTERLLAAALIMTEDHENVGEVIADRLHVSRVHAWRLMDLIHVAGNNLSDSSVSEADVN